MCTVKLYVPLRKFVLSKYIRLLEICKMKFISPKYVYPQGNLYPSRKVCTPKKFVPLQEICTPAGNIYPKYVPRKFVSLQKISTPKYVPLLEICTPKWNITGSQNFDTNIAILDMVPVEGPLNTILKNTPKCGWIPHYSIKWTDFWVPVIPWTAQNVLDNADTAMPLAQDCLALLNDSPTGHYTNTGMHSSSLWLSFLAIIQQGRALECVFVVLNGTSTHCHAYWNIPEASEVGTPLYSGHFRWQQCPHYRGSTVYIKI